MIKAVSDFIKKTAPDRLLVIWFFLFSLVLRVHRLSHYISFHQDQVRDLLFVKNSFEKLQPILLGPKASVGNFFLPPFWYYLMSFAYTFSKSPLAPAFLTALLSSLTAVVIFLFVKKYFGTGHAFLATSLYAVSPLSIEYSRFAWNPNPIPLFVILSLYFLYGFIFENREKYFIYGTITANLAFQLHYQGLVVMVFYFLMILYYKKINLRRFFIYLSTNILLVSPFIIYELLNNFRNTGGIINFVFSSQLTTKLRFFGIPFFIKFIIRDFSFFLARSLFFKNHILGYAGLAVFALSLGLKTLFFNKLQRFEKPLVLFFVLSMVMLFFYKNSLIDFYLLFLIPVVVIYFVLLLGRSPAASPVFLAAAVLVFINLVGSPAFGIYDRTFLWITESTKILSKSKNYCIAYNIFPQNYIESKYRYMVSLLKNKPVYDNCDQNLYYRCDPKVEVGYYLCEAAICTRSPIDLPRGKFIDMKPLDSGVKIYEFDL